jgi:hypothetical protein
MKKLILFIMLFSSWPFFAQVGIGTTTPDASAMLDVQSTTSGFAMPRMTSDERNNIANPIEGLQVYDTDYKTIWVYSGNEWRSVNPVAYGRVRPNGAVVRIFGASVTKLNTGKYRITFNTPMPTDDYIISLSLRLEPGLNKENVSIMWRDLTTEKFDVFIIKDNDDNTGDETWNNNMFMFTVFY